MKPIKFKRSKLGDLLYGVTVHSEWGHAVAQLVEALRYKSEGRRFDSRWCHWKNSDTSEYQEYFLEVKAAGA